MNSRPRLQKECCFNRPFGRPACRSCAEVCPAEAIGWDDEGMPRLDDARCTGCMACVARCPGDAWQDQGWDLLRLRRQAALVVARGRSLLHVRCSAAGEGACDARVTCHGGWDALALAVIAAEGVTRLALHGVEACARCPRRYGGSVVQEQMEHYRTLSRGMVLRLELGSVEGADGAEEPTRRRFFRRLLPALAQGAASVVAAARRPEVEEECEVADGRRPPLRLRLFVRALERLHPSFTPVPASLPLPLGSIQVSDACDGCGACVACCPVDVLGLRRFGAGTILEFDAAACVGCAICLPRCPQSAITMLPAVSLPAMSARRPRPLALVAQEGDGPGG